MKKNIQLMTALAVSALALTGCTSDSLQASSELANRPTAEDNAVRFGTYTGKYGNNVTRAGVIGELTTDALKGTSADPGPGFGVFAYYGDNAVYADASSTPNFMYNQQVTWNTTNNAWTYTPVKYWPNEFGSTASSDSRIDRLTFFAYAPFVNNTPSTGAISSPGESGILAFVKNTFVESDEDKAYKNTSTGDPRIKFKVDNDPKKCVDLLWGVMPSATDYEIADNPTTPATSGAGLPWLNITKQSTAGKVEFNFKHALAKLIFMVDADVDDVRDGTSDHSKALDTDTKIYVRKVVIKGKIAQEGYLNLNNTTADAPLWEKADGSAIGSDDVTFTFHDGRTDGKEGNADANPATDDTGNSSSETLTSLNSALIQTATTGDGTVSSPYILAATGEPSTSATGVTNTSTALLTNGGVFYVIPTSSSSNTFEVEIVYDVLTKDPNLYDTLADGKIHGSLIKNDIKKPATLTIEAGKAYTFNLHLGMTSVKMEASVANWEAAADTEVDLPVNSATPGS